jgi:hypothetical protein
VIAIRSRFAWGGLLVALCLATPALADAPKGPNGQYENFVYEDQQIKDRWTKLRWRRRVTGLVTHAVATTNCANLGNGHRLPTVKELLTLVDEEPNREYDTVKLQNVNKYIDDEVFPETPTNAPFWTSSIKPGTTRAYTVDFATGEANDDTTTATAYYRCVQYDP